MKQVHEERQDQRRTTKIQLTPRPKPQTRTQAIPPKLVPRTWRKPRRPHPPTPYSQPGPSVAAQAPEPVGSPCRIQGATIQKLAGLSGGAATRSHHPETGRTRRRSSEGPRRIAAAMTPGEVRVTNTRRRG